MTDIERMKLYQRAFAILANIDQLLLAARANHEASTAPKKAA